jgi:hypothetical protein
MVPSGPRRPPRARRHDLRFVRADDQRRNLERSVRPLQAVTSSARRPRDDRVGCRCEPPPPRHRRGVWRALLAHYPCPRVALATRQVRRSERMGFRIALVSTRLRERPREQPTDVLIDSSGAWADLLADDVLRRLAVAGRVSSSRGLPPAGRQEQDVNAAAATRHNTGGQRYSRLDGPVGASPDRRGTFAHGQGQVGGGGVRGCARCGVVWRRRFR